MVPDAVVYVVDDLPAVVDLACRCLRSAGISECRGYTSAEQMLQEFAPAAADCVVADLKMPGIEGDELHRRISSEDPPLSFVFISGYADVRTAVRIMEQGAVTLIEKPFASEDLVVAVERAVERTRQLRSRRTDQSEVDARLRTLTPEEREVMELMVAGLPNKAIAHQLSISSRTMDRRRQSVLRKMNAASLAELMAAVLHARSPRF